MIYERNTLNYAWIDRTRIFGAILLFYRHDECNMENREMNIVISLSIVGLLILVIDKRQDRYIDGIFTQHK